MNTNKLSILYLFASFITLLVISAGAWVRLTDAGLGCPDWPGCYGMLSAPISDESLEEAKKLFPNSAIDSGKAFREMIHRYLAGFLGLYVFVISYLTIKANKKNSNIVVIFLIILILVQSFMGMLTVTEQVKPTIVTVHLLLGMLTVSLLFWQFLNLKYKNKSGNKNIFSFFIIICITLLTTQIFLGAWTSTNYASLACSDFPKCLNQWWPEGMNFTQAFTFFNLPSVNYEGGFMNFNSKLAIHFLHRIGALFLSIFFLFLFIYIFFIQNKNKIKEIGVYVLILFVLQIFLGISNILFKLPLLIAVLHTLNASLLLISMISLAYYSTRDIK